MFAVVGPFGRAAAKLAAKDPKMHILFVDAGNYCRSPAAEAVAKTMIAERGLADRVTVASAGLKDKHAGGPPDPRTVNACAERGYVLDGFLCREITSIDYAMADVVLAMDTDTLSALEMRRPSGNDTEIRRFLGDADVPDPYYGGDDGFTEMMDLIESGMAPIIGDASRSD